MNFHIYSIPFHGDEINGLIRNRVITDTSYFFERMISLKGFFQRPLSVFSYVLNNSIFGKSPASFHAVNLAIHLANIYLLFQVAKSFKVNPFISSAVFALHPLTSACVGQIYGRNYSLGFMFVLLGLCRRDFLFYLFAFLSKQVFIYFPILLLWKKGPSKKDIMLGLGLVVFAIGAFYVHILPNLENAPVSAYTYFLSQLEHLPLILFSSFIVPCRNALIHRLEFYSGGYGPLLGAAVLAFLFGYALLKRRTKLGVLIGCFLIAYLPTNSFIPKTEVLLEWRLYPAVAFFALISSLFFEKYKKLLVVYLLVCSVLLIRQNYIYNSKVRTYQQVLSIYPESITAHNNLGYQYLRQEKYVLAEQHFLAALKVEPKYSRAKSNLYLLYNRTKQPQKAEKYRPF